MRNPDIQITQKKWDDALQDYVPIPLDDSDPWVIALASRVHGRGLTQEQLKRVLNERCSA